MHWKHISILGLKTERAGCRYIHLFAFLFDLKYFNILDDLNLSIYLQFYPSPSRLKDFVLYLYSYQHELFTASMSWDIND